MLGDALPVSHAEVKLLPVVPPRRLCHPKLVQLYGVCLQQRPLLIVAEFMENGCLLNFLRQRGAAVKDTWLLSMCQDVCEGMEYLEAHSFIHRDLVSPNHKSLSCPLVQERVCLRSRFLHSGRQELSGERAQCGEGQRLWDDQVNNKQTNKYTRENVRCQVQAAHLFRWVFVSADTFSTTSTPAPVVRSSRSSGLLLKFCTTVNTAASLTSGRSVRNRCLVFWTRVKTLFLNKIGES